MKLVQASTKRVYENEKKPMIRVISSGIKLTDLMVQKLGLNLKGEPAERTVNYATDQETGKLYLYKSTEGATVGTNKCFVSSGLKGDMLLQANSSQLKVKGGIQVIFSMDVEGTEVDGTTYFGMSFERVEESSDDEDQASPSTSDDDDDL
jgi:hypothetical protein